MESNIFDLYLNLSWTQTYEKNREIFKSGIEKIQTKKIDNFIAYYNSELISNKRQSQYSQYDSNNGILEEFDSSKFNFNKISDKEILFYIDLQNMQVISKEEKQFQEDDEDMDYHPILVNISPIATLHSLLPLFPKDELPQFLGMDLVGLCLDVFNLTQQKQLKLLYNSNRAFSTVNHLHLHVLLSSSIENLQNELPIELFEKRTFIQDYLPSEEEYTVCTQVSELVNYPVFAFVVESVDDENDDKFQIYNSVSRTSGVIIESLLNKSIPHNLLFTNLGKTVYIIPRQDQSAQQSEDIKCAVLEVCGVALCRNYEFYENLNEDKFSEVLQKEVSVSQSVFEALKQEFIDIFNV